MGFTEFFDAYVECALWSSTVALDEDEWDTADQYELSDEARTTLEEEALDFFYGHRGEWIEAGWTDAQAGNDFWLTRNGHGAGFWDRGKGEAGKALTKASKAYGGIDFWLGDDDQLHVM